MHHAPRRVLTVRDFNLIDGSSLLVTLNLTTPGCGYSQVDAREQPSSVSS